MRHYRTILGVVIGLTLVMLGRFLVPRFQTSLMPASVTPLPAVAYATPLPSPGTTVPSLSPTQTSTNSPDIAIVHPATAGFPTPLISPPPSGTVPATVMLNTTSGSRQVPNIEYHALFTPDDYHNQWYTDIIHAPAAWDKTTGSSNTVVAVIDTGFALKHDELADRWATNNGEIGATASEGAAPNCTSRGLALDKSCNNFDDDSDGYVDDWRGWDFDAGDNDPQAGTVNPNGGTAWHGTATAGLIGAAGNNDLGVASINWQTRIMPLQALSDDGVGYTSTIATAMQYAVDHGANVISMSLGADVPDDALQAEIDYATAHNVLVVAAAGNDGCDCLSYPANYPDVLAVGATDANDDVAAFSSWGSNLDLSAPGSGTIVTPVWTPTNGQNGYTSSIAGTSFSTPITAGLAAILKGLQPEATPSQITSWLTSTADPVTSGHGGAGRINAAAAIAAASPTASNVRPARTTPLYRVYSGTNTVDYTTNLDTRNQLMIARGYQYDIAKFVPF